MRFDPFIAKMNDWLKCLALIGLAIGSISFAWGYEVCFEGIADPKMKELIVSISQLERLKASPPATTIGLKRRAEADVPYILSALHSLAYYRAKVTFEIQNDVVIVHLDCGPVYPFEDVQIHYFQDGEQMPLHLLPNLDASQHLGIQLGTPALPEAILNAEDALLNQLNLKGYAFALIKNREVLVDQRTQGVIVKIDVETGPLTYFGALKITGEERVKPSFFYKKLRWEPGDLYDPLKLEKTQEALELSGLFRSINIKHAEEPVDGNLIPLQIDVVEAKQRSIGFGMNYMTTLGPGITGEWEDRNILGEGERLSLRGDIWPRLQEGRIAYVVPDFWQQDQDLVWLVEYSHEKTSGFIETAFSVSAMIEKQINDRLRISYGGMYKLLRSEHSDHNGTFELFKAPFQLRWSSANSLLDPTKGVTLNFKSVPTIQMFSPQFAYAINTFTGSLYQSLCSNDRAVLALKLMVGSIVGASKHDIPPPERFYAGSETALRGYKYLTVSPLEHHRKPIGGRSLFIYSLETRFKVGKNWGLVAFYEIGNVFADACPALLAPWLQSAGVGIRYHTPVGPLRLDFAVPLNRREKIDPPFQIYFSIGQAF